MRIVPEWLVAAGISLIVITLSPKLLPFLVGFVVLTAIALPVILRPNLFLLGIVLLGPVTGLLREAANIGGVSLSGLIWVGFWVIGIGLTVIYLRKSGVPGSFQFLLLFGLWTAFRLATSGTGIIGLKDVVFYTVPLVVAIAASAVSRLQEPTQLFRSLESLVFKASFVPIMVFVVLLMFGGIEHNLKGGDWGLLNARAVSIYLIVLIALLVGRSKYDTVKLNRDTARMLSLLFLCIILFTVSRMASLIGLIVILSQSVNPARSRTLFVIGVTGIAVTWSLIMYVPDIQERFFYSPPASLADGFRKLNMSGRQEFWPLTFVNALQQPIIGNGPGSARILLARNLAWVEGGEWHPHNEYLQVFHDMGIVGLLLFLIAWLGALIHSFRMWKLSHLDGNVVGAKWAMASFLGIGAILINSLVDNTFHYAGTMTLAAIYYTLAIRSNTIKGIM